MKKFFLIMMSLICLTSCEQQLAKSLGGTTTIKLQPGERLLECTWKGDEIWYLVEPMDSNYIPKTKEFKENSVMGVIEGKVIFIETR